MAHAKLNYEKSLAEFRSPETKTLLSDVESLIREEERKAYINPELSEQEKEKGNEFFRKGQFADALKCYSEAIKRDPSDAKIYSNRAACYTKLAAFDLGLKDCETCLELEPNFGNFALPECLNQMFFSGALIFNLCCYFSQRVDS